MVYTQYVNAGSVYAVSFIFPTLCTVSVALRFFARKSKKVGHGPDDWMSVVALLLTTLCAVVMIYGDAAQLIGLHSPLLTESSSLVTTLETKTGRQAILEWAFILTSVLAIGAVRLIFALLYRRIFHQDIFKVYRTVNWIIIIFTIVWAVTFFLANLFQCGTHFPVMWKSDGDFSKDCPGSFKIALAMAASDVVIDFALLITPIFPVLKLNMRHYEKASVVGIFALGLFSIAAGLTRLVIVAKLYPFESSNELYGLEDVVDEMGVVSVGIWWTFVEIGMGLLVSQLPVVSGLLRGEMKGYIESVMTRTSLTPKWTFRSSLSKLDSVSSAEEGNAQYHKVQQSKLSA